MLHHVSTRLMNETRALFLAGTEGGIEASIKKKERIAAFFFFPSLREQKSCAAYAKTEELYLYISGHNLCSVEEKQLLCFFSELMT